MLLSFVSYESHGKAASDGGEQKVIEPPFPRWGGGFSFVDLLPFTCDFSIYSPRFKTASTGRYSGERE